MYKAITKIDMSSEDGALNIYPLTYKSIIFPFGSHTHTVDGYTIRFKIVEKALVVQGNKKIYMQNHKFKVALDSLIHSFEREKAKASLFGRHSYH